VRSWTRPVRLAAAVAAGLAPLVAACAASRFDRLYEAGMYEKAAEVYRADTTLHHREGALYRSAMMHALPGSPVYDPQQAREELDRLLVLFPGTGHRASIVPLRSLLGEIVRQRRDLAAARTELRRLTGRVRSLQERVDGLEEGFEGQRAHLDSLRGENRRLIDMLRVRADTLRRLRTELRKLKAIDLRGVSDTTGSGGPPRL